MSPPKRLAALCAVVALAAPAKEAFAATAPRAEQDAILLQTKAAAARAEAADDLQRRARSGSFTPEDVAAIGGLSAEVQELKALIQAMHQSIDGKLSKCCGGCSGGGGNETKPPLSGLCAAFGDPHFTTFDGAHTILLKDMPLWLVKSKEVWIQAMAKSVWGNLMGVAIGGPFMEGHRLIVYNSSLDEGSSGGLAVLYDGTPILADVDSEGNSNFHTPFLLSATRRATFSATEHDRAVLEMDPAVDFDVGPWPERFQTPEGGLYFFKLPHGIEVTLTGVDFMSVVVKMTPEAGGQSGYCGNFDGVSDDEFKPGPPGSVPEVLAPAWNSAVGEGLEPVVDAENLFLGVDATATLVRLVVEGPALQPGMPHGPVPQQCSEELMRKSEEACSGIRDKLMWQACVIDICLERRPTLARDVAAAEVLQEEGNAAGVPTFIGHGRCVDSQGRQFHTLLTRGVRNFAECMSFLREAAASEGVQGAQLQVGGACELVVDPGVGVSAPGMPTPPLGGWVEVPSTGEPGGAGFVAAVAEERSWSCWRLN